ncbi:MAG: hypothetical protein ACLT1K_05790, partial [[Clostridium] leptum]
NSKQREMNEAEHFRKVTMKVLTMQLEPPSSVMDIDWPPTAVRRWASARLRGRWRVGNHVPARAALLC